MVSGFYRVEGFNTIKELVEVGWWMGLSNGLAESREKNQQIKHQ